MQWSRRDFTIGCASLMASPLVGCERERPTIQSVSEPAPPPGLAGVEEAGIEDLQAILERRAAAVQDDDEQAFLADLDQSNQKLLDRQRTVFANLRQLEFDNFRYLTAGIIPPPADENGISRFAPVIGITKLAIDAAPGGVAPAEAFEYDLIMQDGKPVVRGIVPITRRNAEQLEVTTDVFANAPWNTTPLDIVKVDNVWLAGDDTVNDLQQYADAAQAQVAQVEALWGDRTRFPGYILFFTRRKPNLKAWYDFGKQSDMFDGVEVPLQGVRRNGQVYRGQYAGARIVVNLRNIELSGNDPAHVMRHELAHAITARATAVDIGLGDFSVVAPRWAIEGFARWVENLETPDRQAQQRAIIADGVATGMFADTTPETESFYDQSSVHFNYAVSASVFDYAEQIATRDDAIELYAQTIDHGDLTGEPLVGLPAFDGICQRVLGMGSSAFLQDWAAFVRSGA